jgi:hypothetical protein
MTRIVRLNENDLSRIVRRVLKEDNFCKPNDKRGNCFDLGEAKTIGGKMIPLDDGVYMMVTIEGCPKLCKVEDEIYKLS